MCMSLFRPLFFFMLFSSSFLSAQKEWNLAQCIEYATRNNIQLQQTGISVDMSAIDIRETRHKFLPDLSAMINSGSSFGRNIDPTTNSFTTENILYSNYSLSSSVVLFQGGLLRNSYKQAKYQHAAATQDYRQALNDLGLGIASYYLNVLLTQDNLEVSAKNLEINRIQLEQVEKMIKAGVRPEADAFEIKSQLARAEQNFVLAENQLDLAWLQLRQAMRLGPDEEMSLVRLTEEQLKSIPIELFSYEELIGTASAQQPALEAARIRLNAAILGEKISRSLFYPSLFLSGSIGSRYSDAAVRVKEYGTQRITVPGVLIDGKAVQFEQDYPKVLSTEVTPFSRQFDQFLGYGVALSLSIPIYRNYSANASVQKAKLNTKLSELSLAQKKEQLDQNIYTAIANVKAAAKALEASMKAFEAAKVSFDKTQKKNEIGAASTFELNLAQNTFQSAELNLVMARYDLVFKQKVLDYYAGKPIKL